jgi:hypothetical protein
LVNGTIAVEVRRLNQNEITESGHRGLEVTRIPLAARIRKLLSTFGPSRSGISWFCHDFKRPLPENLAPQIVGIGSRHKYRLSSKRTRRFQSTPAANIGYIY